MRKTSTSLYLVLCLAMLAGCKGSPSETGGPAPVPVTTGSVQLSVSVPDAFAASVTRVSVTASGADFSSVSAELARSNGVWGGVFGNIPVGSQRTLLAQGFDSAGTKLLEGSVTGVTISAQGTPPVTITLRQVDPPPPVGQAPVIDSLELSGPSVPAGGTLSVVATAHDPDPGDTLTYAWSSPVGTFSSASSTTTAWTAPVFVGTQLLVLTVTDSKGRSSSKSLDVVVTSSAPVILSSSYATPTVTPGQEVSFDVVANDPSSSPLAFSWSTTSGTLGLPENSTTSSRISWTSPNCATAGTPPTVTVLVTNASGQTTGKRFFAKGLPACPTVGWTAGLSMSRPRNSHTATLLPDGRVLVSGGYGTDSTILGEAELYDPVKGTWRVTASMGWNRYDHTATLLADGRVLVSGGANSGGFLATAEVYDPATGTWSATGAMSAQHWGHTATLLPNGKVLVTGGFVATTELYDPATNTWSTTGSPSTSRTSHTAALLPDGRVLVAGGYNLKTAELYDPATGTWSATASLPAPRMGHTATLLPDGQVLVAAGYDGTNHLTTAEVYDPATGSWTAVGSLTSRRSGHTATALPNGQVLVAGGGNGTSLLPAKAEVYDPATRSWSEVASMVTPRYDHTATLLPNGRVLVAGGTGTTWPGTLSATEVYIHPPSP